MYKKYILGFLLFFLIGLHQTIFAQNWTCATDDIHQEMLATDPNYRATFERMQVDLQRHIAEKMANAATQRTEATVYTIPVVVHVIHTGGAVGSIYNPSVADINDMLNKINTDFRNTAFGADVEINFVLAQRDPNCNATTGIVRVNGSGLANYTDNGVGTGGATDAAVKALSIWSNTDYYNIWIVNKINGNDGDSPGTFTAGYAYFPGAPANIDGTVILATQVNGTSETMTHELGHAFALHHTFHKAETGNDSANATDCPLNTDCTTQGDLICDTDPHAYMLGACDAGNCGGVSAATRANYMSYCSGTDRFTPNQVTRMRTALETQRGGLISSLGGTAPSGTLPVACTPTHTGAIDNALGVTRFSLNTLNLSSTGSSEGTYVNRTCGQGTTVTAGSNQTITVQTSINPHNVKVYIDYNRDGDFTDVSEEIASGATAEVGGIHTFTSNYSFPSTGITFNQPLRLRVVAAFINTVPSSCAITEGQAEDYSITIQNNSCSITAITAGTQTPCVPATNQYTQQVTVTYTNPPATGNLVVNGQNFPITTSPQTVTLTGLTADGNPVNAVASFSANAACTFTQNNAFTAPANCTVLPCSITAITAGTQTPCVPATNQYTQQVTVTYTNPPATGNLVVNGQNFPITTSPQTVTLTGLTADGNPVNAIASFSANAACTFTQNNAFTAPNACNTGNITNIQQGTFYTTLQEAVNAANDGETLKILVNNTYNEDVTITNKSLTITSDATDYTQITVKQIIFDGTGRTLTISTHMGISELLNMQEGRVVVTEGNNFVLRSTTGGTAMVINDDANTVEGNVIMERYLPSIADLGGYDAQGYHMFSSPFSNATVSQFGDDMNLILTPSFNTAVEPTYTVPFPTFYRYDEPSSTTPSPSGIYGAFTMGYKVPLASDNLGVMQGYEANIATGSTVDLNGMLNNGDLVYPLSRVGTQYNLVGNPYPAPIKWSLVAPLSTNVTPTIFIDIAQGQYAATFATYNYLTNIGLNGGKDDIAPMQGFFVRTNENLGTPQLVMNNSVRATTYQDVRFLKTTETQGIKEGLIKLGISQEGSMDEMAICFIPDATENYDNLYDAEKIHKINGYSPTLYSYNQNTSTQKNEYFAINTLPKFNEDMILPLAMNIVKSGKHKIVVREIKYFHSLSNVYLYDSLTETLHDLKANPEYEFVAEANKEVKRFVLLFKTNKTFTQKDHIVAYPNPTSTTFSYSLKNDREGSYTIRLFDATGKLILERQEEKQGAFLEGTINLENQAAGLYLLQISDANQTNNVRIVKE